MTASKIIFPRTANNSPLAVPTCRRFSSPTSCTLPASFALTGVLAALSFGTALAPGAWSWPALLAAWALLGAASSVVLTPSGRLLRRSATAADLPAAFAAQFSLSHSCWLLTYPLAAGAGLPVAAAALTAVALIALSRRCTPLAAQGPCRARPCTPRTPRGAPALDRRRPDGRRVAPHPRLPHRPTTPSLARRPTRTGRRLTRAATAPRPAPR